MDNTRCIAVRSSKENPDGLVKVVGCSDCPLRAIDYEGSGFCNLEYYPECKLLSYEKMRLHTADEKPDDSKPKLVELKNGQQVVAYYGSAVELWIEKTGMNSPIAHGVDDIKSWRHLEYS